MNTEHPGLPTIARNYWRQYVYSVFGMTSLVVFTGAFGAVIILMFLPEAKWYFLLGAVSFVFHMAGLFIRDVRRDAWEPSQTTLSSASQILAIVILLGVVESTLLLIGTIGGYVINTVFELPVVIAALVAAYYPVLDIVLMRNDRYTPGALVFLIAILVIDAVINIHESVLSAIPLIGKPRRPQF